MAYEIIRPNFALPVQPASNIVPRSVVRLVGSNALRVLPVASSNQRPFGVIGGATAPLVTGQAAGQAGVVQEEGNIVKAIAGASLGAGCEVCLATIGIASAAQGGSYVATVTQLGPLTAASGAAVWAVGISLDAVAAGEIFTLYVKPRLTGGLA